MATLDALHPEYIQHSAEYRSGTGFWKGACKILGSPSVDDSPCVRLMVVAGKVRLEIHRPETINVIFVQSHLFSILE